MSVSGKKKVISKTQIVKSSKAPPFQSEQQQQLAHLRTMLLLTQLNCTYHQIALSFRKATDSLENKYRQLKLGAFLKLKHSRPNRIDVRARQIQSADQQRLRQRQKVSGQLELHLLDEQERKKDLSQLSLGKIDNKILGCQVAINCKTKMQNMINKISKKRKGLLCLAFHRIQNAHQYVSGNILSEKSSRIDTNDSQKSKIFKRSVQRQQANRKSFSLDKNTTNKKQYHVPVKYQRSNQKQILQTELHKMESSPSSSTLNRFLQDKGQIVSSKGRRNLVLGGDKKMTKCSSSKRLNMSVMQTQRQQKANELQYLKTKYKKLMDQFNWFSDRFLKVIEEQDGIQ